MESIYCRSSVQLATLALGSVFLLSCDQALRANGYYQSAGSVVYNQKYSDPNPGTSMSLTGTAASCSSNYAATKNAQSTYGECSEDVHFYYQWIDSDGKSPSPPALYDKDVTGTIGGGATTTGGANSRATASGAGSMSAPGNFSYSNSTITNDAHDLNPIIITSVDALSSANPDNTSDPADENYGNPTEADALAQISAQMILDSSIKSS